MRVSVPGVPLIAVALVAAISLSGCGASAPLVTHPASTPAIATPEPAPPAPVNTNAPPALDDSTAVPTMPSIETVQAAAEPRPLFGPAWGNRAIFRGGLVSTQREILSELRGATEYRIDLNIDEERATIRGRQQSRYTNTEATPLADIYFRLFPNSMGGSMSVSEVTVNGQAVLHQMMYEDTALHIPLSPRLEPGANIIIQMDYVLTAPENPGDRYGLLSHSEGILALDSPYAMIPVFDNEGWNVEVPPQNADTSYNDMSFYLVRVDAPEELTLAVVGVEVETQTTAGRRQATYAAGPVRDFYLAGSENYEVVSQQVGEITIRSYAGPGGQKAADTALKHGAAAVASFGRRFAPYPYTELELAATPMRALGIEYPGVVGIANSLYQTEALIGGRAAEDVIKSTVAHEVAHQWFYNLVGNDQIDEPWLDESLAQYATSLYLLDSEGEAASRAYRDTWLDAWDRVDRSTKPIGLPAKDYSGAEYSAIVYGRGPLFLDALRSRMGEADFDRALRSYSEEYRWRISTTPDFRKTAEAECSCDLTDLFEEWVYE